MKVEVNLLSPLAEVAGVKAVTLQFGEEVTLCEVIRTVTGKFPQLRKYIESGREIFPQVMVEGKGVYKYDVPEIFLADGDKIILFYVLSGG